jgi:hypothetical protein
MNQLDCQEKGRIERFVHHAMGCIEPRRAWTDTQEMMAETVIQDCIFCDECPPEDSLAALIILIRKAALDGDDTLSRMVAVARRTAESVYVEGSAS